MVGGLQLATAPGPFGTYWVLYLVFYWDFVGVGPRGFLGIKVLGQGLTIEIIRGYEVFT